MSNEATIPLPRRVKLELIISSLAINGLMLAMPIATLQIYDRVLVHPGGGTLLMLSVGVVVAVIMETFLRLARSRVSSSAARAYEQAHSERLMAHILASWCAPAQRHHHGEYVQALSAVTRMKDYALQRLITVSVDVPYIVLFLVLLGVIGGVLVVVPLVAVTIFGVLVVSWGRKLRRAIAARNAADEQRYGFMLEALGGVHVIKSLGLEPIFIHRYRHLQSSAGESGFVIAWLNHALANSAALFSQIMVVLVVACGAPLVMQGTLSMGALIACVLLSGRLIQPLQHALLCWMGYQEFEQAHAQIAHIETMPQQPLQPQLHARQEGRVACHALGFRYGPEAPWIVQDIDLTLAHGEAVALMGESSSGRSTLLKLMTGILEPSSGQVLVDGVDPASMFPHQLARHIAYLAPEPTLLRGTIMQNLTCFDPSMVPRAMELAHLIGLDHVVSQLPQGFETELEGSQAEMIPPGFRQRVAMARALLHKPKLILFDQADRSLDRDGYHQLFRLFARIKGKATMLLVSDDQNLTRLCDRTVVIRHGRIDQPAGSPSSAPRLQLVQGGRNV